VHSLLTCERGLAADYASSGSAAVPSAAYLSRCRDGQASLARSVHDVLDVTMTLQREGSLPEVLEHAHAAQRAVREPSAAIEGWCGSSGDGSEGLDAGCGAHKGQTDATLSPSQPPHAHLQQQRQTPSRLPGGLGELHRKMSHSSSWDPSRPLSPGAPLNQALLQLLPLSGVFGDGSTAAAS
jgi:hypothetical protein